MKLSERRALSEVLPWLNRYRNKTAYTLVGFNIHYNSLTAENFDIVESFLEKRDEDIIILGTGGVQDGKETLIHYFSVAKTPHELWTEHCLASNIVLPIVKTAYPTVDIQVAVDTVDQHRQALKEHYNADLPKYVYEPMEALGNTAKLNEFFDGALLLRQTANIPKPANSNRSVN